MAFSNHRKGDDEIVIVLGGRMLTIRVRDISISTDRIEAHGFDGSYDVFHTGVQRIELRGDVLSNSKVTDKQREALEEEASPETRRALRKIALE